jgi:hypothetical protein
VPANIDIVHDKSNKNDFFVTPYRVDATVDMPEANVRTRPGPEGRLLINLAVGTKVRIIGTSGSYFAIEQVNTVGFILQSWVKLPPGAPAVP